MLDQRDPWIEELDQAVISGAESRPAVVCLIRAKKARAVGNGWVGWRRWPWHESWRCGSNRRVKPRFPHFGNEELSLAPSGCGPTCGPIEAGFLG
jgi:hypothetical protein